jgi:hypothetical protein
MHLRKISLGFALFVLMLGAVFTVQAQKGNTVSAPYIYKNLTVYLIYGKDQMDHKNILTLQEAMEKDLIIVYETSSVNELEVENVSPTYEIFIQSGDIVKGGKQDRVLAVDIILPVKSGRVKISAFCVESGRWTQRKGEDKEKFGSSNDRVVTRDLKLAANLSKSQGEVWKKVAEAQDKLSTNVGTKVNSAVSNSSLQLALENKQVAATTDEYIKKLAAIVDGKTNVVGYAFVINGEVNSADVYASSALFKKLWPKLLRATAVEAVSELTKGQTYIQLKPETVQGFLDRADSAAAKEEKVNSRVTTVTRDEKDAVVFESRDEKQKVVLHKSYVKKQ